MEELDLKELISIFLNKKYLIIIVLLIFAIMGIIYTSNFITPLYQSSTSLVLVQIAKDNSSESNSITATDVTLNSKLVEDYREIAKSKSVANKVKENLKWEQDISEIQKSISVTAISDTELIQITVTESDPELACKIANEVARVFRDKVSEIYNVSNVHVLDKAEVPTEPSNIHLFKNIVIFMFIGFILVSAYILLVNMLDTTIKTDTDIEKALGIPVLASIVQTDESVKKKIKKNTNNSESIEDSENNAQVLYKNNSIVKNMLNNKENDNISVFSYMNGDQLRNDLNNENDLLSFSKTQNYKRRKGGRKSEKWNCCYRKS